MNQITHNFLHLFPYHYNYQVTVMADKCGSLFFGHSSQKHWEENTLRVLIGEKTAEFIQLGRLGPIITRFVSAVDRRLP